MRGSPSEIPGTRDPVRNVAAWLYFFAFSAWPVGRSPRAIGWLLLVCLVGLDGCLVH
jgi:hypothetical protein